MERKPNHLQHLTQVKPRKDGKIEGRCLPATPLPSIERRIRRRQDIDHSYFKRAPVRLARVGDGTDDELLLAEKSDVLYAR